MIKSGSYKWEDLPDYIDVWIDRRGRMATIYRDHEYEPMQVSEFPTEDSVRDALTGKFFGPGKAFDTLRKGHLVKARRSVCPEVVKYYSKETFPRVIYEGWAEDYLALEHRAYSCQEDWLSCLYAIEKTYGSAEWESEDMTMRRSVREAAGKLIRSHFATARNYMSITVVSDKFSIDHADEWIQRCIYRLEHGEPDPQYSEGSGSVYYWKDKMEAYIQKVEAEIISPLKVKFPEAPYWETLLEHRQRYS
jgi:hypothetical protein